MNYWPSILMNTIVLKWNKEQMAKKKNDPSDLLIRG